MAEKNYSRYFQFFLIILAAGSIFPLIYLKTNYQETILEVYGISLKQLNGIFSVLGVAYLVGYSPSGWLADRFSAKKLLFISLLICGLTGLWFAQVPSYSMVLVIFGIWGFFSVFTFWAAHLKLVKLIAKKEEEGRFFGALDGGRGLVEAILASIALFIFTNVLGDNTAFAHKKEALQFVVYMYSTTLILVSVLILIFVKEDKISIKKEFISKAAETRKKVNMKDFKQIFSNKFIWLLGGIIFMSYIVTWSVYYQGGFLQTNIKIDAATVGKITVLMLWMRPIGGVLGGFLGDKFGRSNILMIALGLAATFLIAISTAPITMPHMYFKIQVVMVGLMIYTVRGLYWSLLGECKIDEKVLGLAIGVVSFIGYLPDILMPLVNIELFKTLGPNGGYNGYFIFCACAAILAIFMTLVFRKSVKKVVKNSLKTDELIAEKA
ncbi:MFS transporter [Priestia megaterium]|uniref:MFS transporter n=1 Tax=Priestia megaterium TaxID=1404 RepID=UPI000BF94154|nr:MFS transporter [Priestia megaterium]PFE34904.1 MFS transporter [Priestia megaterium]PGZ77297.1 MFS transporter [Priestia megaterium]